jgi:hypothetical protein
MIIPRKILLLATVVTLSSLPMFLGCGRPEPGLPRITATTEATVGSTRSIGPTTSSERRNRFLASLREAGVPVSLTGESEVLIAEGLCKAFAAGATEARLVEDMQSLGAVWTPESASAMVRSAGTHYCA